MDRKRAHVQVSEHSGFCFGVKRAVALTNKFLKKHKKICSLGPLIHNKWVVRELEKKGLTVVKDLASVKKGYCVVLPSHGIAPERLIGRKGLTFVDTTCPFVFKAQELVRRLAGGDYDIVILGDRNHPEVRGLVGISGGKAVVINGKKAAAVYRPKRKKIALVSQTTQSRENLMAIGSELIAKEFQELRIFNTICRDAAARQDEAKRIARKVDLVLVIGGKNSANTKRLANVCSALTRTRHIESEVEIDDKWFRGVKRVGIVTGASTPGEFIAKAKKRIH